MTLGLVFLLCLLSSTCLAASNCPTIDSCIGNQPQYRLYNGWTTLDEASNGSLAGEGWIPPCEGEAMGFWKNHCNGTCILAWYAYGFRRNMSVCFLGCIPYKFLILSRFTQHYETASTMQTIASQLGDFLKSFDIDGNGEYPKPGQCRYCILSDSNTSTQARFARRTGTTSCRGFLSTSQPIHIRSPIMVGKLRRN